MFFQEKKEEEWTDEERRGAAEYQKKVKELEEEREKFRKVAPLRYSSYLFCIACCHIDTLLYSTHTGTFLRQKIITSAVNACILVWVIQARFS